MKDLLRLSDEVSNALKNGKPVVALESTIISHGMPYPQNAQTALRCQEILRERGVTPATCAVIGGKLYAGLTDEQIDYLGRAGSSVVKASRRDLPLLCSKGMDGATTVAATMIIAALAGIRVFATGGIGGVHRGAETTMDISADLEELAVTPVCVVCAGAKSILDLGLTMEYLETKGVPVIGFRTDELPAFYTRSSGYSVPWRCESAKEIANAVNAQREMGYHGGMLVVNPIPEEYSMDNAFISEAIDKAVAEANAIGIKGKETTPYLLAKIKDLTEGKSLSANIQLVYNNVRLAASIASSMS